MKLCSECGGPAAITVSDGEFPVSSWRDYCMRCEETVTGAYRELLAELPAFDVLFAHDKLGAIRLAAEHPTRRFGR